MRTKQTKQVQKIKTAIVDDDPASVEVLLNGLEAHKDVEVTAVGATVTDMMKILSQDPPQLLFLDVELNEDSALDIIGTLDEKALEGVKIVIYSSYRRYLLQALRLQAFDFLLKPFDAEELDLIMNRYRMALETDHQKCTPVASPITSVCQPLTVTTVTNDRIVLIPDKIVFFKYDSQRKLWEAVLDDFSRMLLRHQTTAETLLNSCDKFVRTHKIFIVNITYIGVISSSACRLIPPYCKYADIKVSKSYRRALLARFYDI